MVQFEAPTELITAILGHLYYKDYETGEPNYQDLYVCSLINKAWNNPAQKLLFHFITQQKCRTFSLSLLAHESNSHQLLDMCRHVRILDIGLTIEKNALACTAEELSRLLLYCANLYEIRFNVGLFFSFNGTSIPVPQSGSQSFPLSNTVRALRLYGSSPQSPILYELLELFPNVQYLTVGTEIISDPPPNSLSNLNLYELVLHRNISVDIFDWLLSTSGSSLSILELRDLPNPRMNTTLFRIAPTLRSLRLLHYNPRAAALVRGCVHLEELILMNFPTFLSFPELPSTLEHFGFMNLSSASSDTLIPIIQLTIHLPRLRMITCSNDSRQLPEFVSLQDACLARGIRLITRPKRVWTMEDPLPAKTFPRTRSVSNFLRMHD
ncbi:hypothetical protein BDQ17DRAFT_1231814 [Cyathus striatus]|nr:hypothetical protein BDQ17DRAFT_1231814 [Cyathus striatus]